MYIQQLRVVALGCILCETNCVVFGSRVYRLMTTTSLLPLPLLTGCCYQLVTLTHTHLYYGLYWYTEFVAVVVVLLAQK